MPKSKEQKRQEALERQEKRNNLTAQQQLNMLDKRFGKNTGATKERIKLMEQMKREENSTGSKRETKENQFKVKKGEDPLKAKKKFKKEQKNK